MRDEIGCDGRSGFTRRTRSDRGGCGRRLISLRLTWSRIQVDDLDPHTAGWCSGRHRLLIQQARLAQRHTLRHSFIRLVICQPSRSFGWSADRQPTRSRLARDFRTGLQSCPNAASNAATQLNGGCQQSGRRGLASRRARGRGTSFRCDASDNGCPGGEKRAETVRAGHEGGMGGDEGEGSTGQARNGEIGARVMGKVDDGVVRGQQCD